MLCNQQLIESHKKGHDDVYLKNTSRMKMAAHQVGGVFFFFFFYHTEFLYIVCNRQDSNCS